MLKSKIVEYLQNNVMWDILYTEKFYEKDGKSFIECYACSSSSGYSITVKKEVTSVNNRNVQLARDQFIKLVEIDIEKFIEKFDYSDDPMEGLDVLFNDGFNYDDFN